MDLKEFTKKYKPHPSYTLIMDIDETFDTHEIRLEIERCYSYLGRPLIHTHPCAQDGQRPNEDKTAASTNKQETSDVSETLSAEDGKMPANEAVAADSVSASDETEPAQQNASGAETAAQNILRIVINLGTRHYWYSKDEGADELWGQIMQPWLHHQLLKISNQTQIYNRRQREIGETELPFTYLEILLESGSFLIRFRLDSQSAIPESESVWVGRIRDAVNSGVLGDGVTQVELPTEISYETQYEQGMQAKAEREAQAALDAKRKEEEEQSRTREAEDAAELAFLESPSLQLQDKEKAFVESIRIDPVTQARIAELNTGDYSGETPVEGSEKTAEEIVAERVEQEAHIPEYLEKKYALPEADFALDYHTWQVSYEDGDVRAFDFEQGAFFDEEAGTKHA